jgi:hypothetical protein
LSRLWIVEGTNGNHLYADLGSINVPAGTSFTINFANDITPTNNQIATDPPIGDTIIVHYVPQQTVECSIINTLGTVESTTLPL